MEIVTMMMKWNKTTQLLCKIIFSTDQLEYYIHYTDVKVILDFLQVQMSSLPFWSFSHKQGGSSYWTSELRQLFP